jgi:hypothetical protein
VNRRYEAAVIGVLVTLTPACIDVREAASRSVRSRASFDLDCPPEQIDLEFLPTSARGTVVGAKGCGRRRAYEVGRCSVGTNECHVTPEGVAATVKPDGASAPRRSDP